MSSAEVPQRAIDLIVERGVRFRLTAPFWRRWLGLDRVTIHPPKVGTVLLMAQAMMTYELDDLELLMQEQPTPKQVEGVTRVVATAILGRRATNEQRLHRLSQRLQQDVTWVSLLELYALIGQMLDLESFKGTTASVGAKVLTMVRVKREGR